MNIFYLDTEPRRAARYHCDNHVVKMILESTQMLSAVHHRQRAPSPPYKLSHSRHPCTLWAGDSLLNYRWLQELASYLCDEYTSRYGKVHKCEELINGQLATPYSFLDFRYLSPTPPPLAMPDIYKIPGNPVKSYRDYYMCEKLHIAKWERGTPAPEWWKP